MFKKQLIWLTVGVLGCAEDLVEVQGVVTLDSPFSGAPAVGVNVTVVDLDGEKIEEVETSDQGLFRAHAPAGESVHLFVQRDDGNASSFHGMAGMNPRANVPPGFAHTFDDQVRQDWLQRFAGCPGVEAGAFTIGQIRVDLMDDTGERPIAHAASVDVFDLEGNHLGEGCYLDGEGTYVNSDATRVGTSGYFGVFGLEQGRALLRVESNIIENEVYLYEYDLFLPEEGSAPRFPVIIPFEL